MVDSEFDQFEQIVGKALETIAIINIEYKRLITQTDKLESIMRALN